MPVKKLPTEIDLQDVRLTSKDIRMDQIEVHLKKYGIAIDNISNALIGSDLNGHKGLVHEIDNVQKDIRQLKEDNNDKKLSDAKNDKYMGRLEASFGICLLAFVGMLAKIIFG